MRPPQKKFLHFYAVFGKIVRIIGCRPLWDRRPLLEILDPSLINVKRFVQFLHLK